MRNAAPKGGVVQPASERTVYITSNPNFKAPGQVSDAISIFLPGIKPSEYKLRASLQSKRNIAAAMIAKTQSASARSLAWFCHDYAGAFLFAGASNAELANIDKFCQRLMLCAMQIEAIDADGGAI